MASLHNCFFWCCQHPEYKCGERSVRDGMPTGKWEGGCGTGQNSETGKRGHVRLPAECSHHPGLRGIAFCFYLITANSTHELFWSFCFALPQYLPSPVKKVPASALRAERFQGGIRSSTWGQDLRRGDVTGNFRPREIFWH